MSDHQLFRAVLLSAFAVLILIGILISLQEYRLAWLTLAFVLLLAWIFPTVLDVQDHDER